LALLRFKTSKSLPVFKSAGIFMKKKQAEERIEKLKKIINHHRYIYHVLDKQEISDSALDSLKKELFDLEQKFPDLIAKDSPTQRIGGKPLRKFEKVEHILPMISLNDAFSRSDLDDWLERISKLLAEQEVSELDFYCELKIDGLAIELVYEKGILKTGSTRGNGKIGEDVTQNLKTVEAIPLKLREKSQIIGGLKKEKASRDIIRAVEKYDFEKPIIVRGEVFISKKDFENVNKNQKKNNLPLYANPRNLAAGSVRQLDPKITALRRLDSFAYELITDFGQRTHQEKHEILKALGLKTNKHNRFCKDLKEVINFHEHSRKIREGLSYEIDGIVVIVNSNKIFEKLGVAGKAPRGAIAFKFPLKQSATVVEDIKVQVGRTGALTPVAVLKPVQVSGVTISRATLHNEGEIKKLDLKIGDTVIVGRAGDVIPDIIKVLPEMRTGKEKEFKMPDSCPVCGSKIEKKPSEAIFYCKNPECFAQKREYFYHFVSKAAFDITGLGPKIIDKLIDEGLISDPSDLFDLEEGDIFSLERFAEKSSQNLISSIRRKKEISLPRFIYGLGIRNVGEQTSIDLSERFSGPSASGWQAVENLKQAGLEDLERVKDIGPIVAKSIHDWFSQKRNKEFLGRLKKAGVKIAVYQKQKSKSQKLKGLTFVFTGEMKSMAREEAKAKVRDLGADVSESVSKKIDFLVAGKNPGSKYKKAK